MKKKKYRDQALDSGQITGPGMDSMGRHGYRGLGK